MNDVERTERRMLSRPLALRLWGDAAGELPPLLAVPAGEAYPLAHGQEQIWFVERLTPGRSVYNVGQAYRIDGELDTPVLRAALAMLVQRHPSLRMRFFERDGRPAMALDPDASLALAEVDLSLHPGELQTRLDAQAHAPFDFERAPLSRATLYRLGPSSHVLQLTSHHLIEDGASRGILFRDLARAYEALVHGGPPFEPLALHFGDFARWQRALLEGDALEKQRRFWQNALATPRAYAELPSDRPRGAVDGHRGARYRHAIDAAAFEALRALGRAHGASTFMTLAAAYLALVSRYSGEPDVVVGFPTAGRMIPETAGLAGCFVNTLALRADFSDDPAFRTHLARVRDFALEAYDNQDLPFNRIVEDLRMERSLARPPLFSTMVSLVERTRATPAIQGLDVAPVEIDPGSAVSDMTLELRESGGGLSARFEYNRDLFDEATVARFAQHFEALLRAVTADPDMPISRLPLLGAAERSAILALGKGDFSGPPLDRPFHELFERQVECEPERTALEFGDERLDYRTLNARANVLARELRANGVIPGAIVGVCLERSTELIVALLGILKAGAAFLPLDRTLPSERLRFMLAETGASALIACGPDAQALAKIAPETPQLDPRAAYSAEAPDDRNLGLQVDPGALAYVLYTSGSTGRPKGVLVPQSALANHMLWMRDAGLVTAGDRILQKTPIAFDVALWECFAPLLAGACVVLAQPFAHKDAAQLVAAIVERAITVAGFVPAMLRFIVEEPRFAECRSLVRVFSAGEALPLELARRFHARSAAELWNLYGPTETTIHSTGARIEQGTEYVSIGRPISRTLAYVLDPNEEPAPLGVAGDLSIGGAGVALGYLARPDLTASAFADDPFAGGGSRLYRTGDRARLRADGTIEYLGRRDRQVKIRGQRIELGEIEAVLASQSSIAEAAVVVRDLGANGPALAAYVVMRGGNALDASELRRCAARSLADSMLPVFWTELPSLPKTVSGKIDYKALPRPEHRNQPLRRPPQGPIELAIADIWTSLLDRSAIERDESFFSAGGHSLLAMRALARMNGALGATLSLAAFFKEPTIEGLAAEIARMPAAERRLEPDPIEEHVDPKELAEIRAQLADLEDDEIEALLLRAIEGG
jgi:amino acid adenylation domain-containing protein